MYGVGASAPSPVSQRSRSAEQSMRRVNENSMTTATKGAVMESCCPPKRCRPPSQRWDPVPERSLLNNPSAIVEAFMKNELHFKQLNPAASGCSCADANNSRGSDVRVSSVQGEELHTGAQLRELDQSVEKERGRWKRESWKKRRTSAGSHVFRVVCSSANRHLLLHVCYTSAEGIEK
ncbi:hypothetical protein C3747_249g1 [Trypanosoma cruzi]|uniref:Uncharacterized protein n=1 Tax=Trypanosoma cruzi TaxID=5693 RepID=A0A2V2VKA5_TRYCR|nr:hypothetical protein C3747_249g1 [Trypanosoma cruzi]